MSVICIMLKQGSSMLLADTVFIVGNGTIMIKSMNENIKKKMKNLFGLGNYLHHLPSPQFLCFLWINKLQKNIAWQEY